MDEMRALQTQGPELNPQGPKKLDVSACSWNPKHWVAGYREGRIPARACWPASLAKSASSRLSMKPCLEKNQVDK